jgi:agmatine deiminase
MAKNELPFKLGYRMPAEWDPHEGTWAAWPKNPDSFPEEILPEAEKAYTEMIGALHKDEKVNLLVDDEESENRARGFLESSSITMENIIFHRIATADVWFRDYGPIFIARNGPDGREIAYTHWMFNAWGNKYDDLKPDSEIPGRIPLKGMKGFRVPIVLEGGSIDTNGRGAFLTTEQCLLNKNRNPNLSRGDIEGYLRDYLGATHIVWLKRGIEGDDTDGHVDDIARFVDKSTVVASLEKDEKDGNYWVLKENFDLLQRATDQDGNRLRVVALPMPKAVVHRGSRLPASYTNFYIANKAVLVPVFGDPNDKEAIGIIQKLFPERKAIGINCRAMVYGFGALHCATQQQPSPR